MARFLYHLIFLTVAILACSAETRVGVILPLSGGTSAWGEGIRRGIDLVEKQNPNAFEFLYEDESFCDSMRAVTAARKLLTLESVKFLVTGCLNGTKAVAPIAKAAGVPILSAGLLDEASISAHDNVFSFSAQIGSEAIYLARYLRRQSIERVAIFRHEDSFTAEFESQFVSAFKPGQPSYVIDLPVTSTFPFQSELTRLRPNKPDAYIVYLGNDELFDFMRTKVKLKDATPVYSGYILESNFDVNKFSDTLDGVKYTYPLMPAESDPIRQKFDYAFKAIYGPSENPSVNAYFVFDGLIVLAEAIESCGSAQLSCVWSRLLAHPHAGASGIFRFLSDGSIIREFVLKEVNGKQFRVVLQEEPTI